MKFITKILAAVFAFGAILSACTKADQLPFYGTATGSAPVLTSSVSTLAPIPADSLKTGITFSWTNPKYATDSATQKFILQIDSSGRGFAKATSYTITAALLKSFVNKDLNTLMLNYGFAFNVAYDVDVRVISSYGNNNERFVSNTVKIKYTPYKIPPKVALPASLQLFIVGSATQGSWSNPVPTPSQELTRIDETTWGGIFQLNSGGSYLFLPVNGSWAAKFGFDGSNNSNNTAGDNFKAEGGDMLAPATAGWYKIIVDFQQGKFTVTPFTQQHGLPNDLFIVGDATVGQWNNPVPVPSQQFTRLNSTKFELASVALTATKQYLLLPENGNWGKKFGVADNTLTTILLGGTLLPEGQNIPAPSVTGNYKVTVDFINNSYKLVKL